MTCVGLALVAVLMFAFGRWGQRNASALAPDLLPPHHRARRERQIRRGAVAWQLGALLPLVALMALVVRGT